MWCVCKMDIDAYLGVEFIGICKLNMLVLFKDSCSCKKSAGSQELYPTILFKRRYEPQDTTKRY